MSEDKRRKEYGAQTRGTGRVFWRGPVNYYSRREYAELELLDLITAGGYEARLVWRYAATSPQPVEDVVD